MRTKKSTTVLALAIVSVLAGCSSDVGSAPLVHVSAQQRALDLNNKAKSTLDWLEKMSPAERQSSIDKIPQVASALKSATDPSLKQRIDSLGIRLK